MQVFSTPLFYERFEKGGAYCFGHVGRYVGMSRSVGWLVGRSPTPCAITSTPERSEETSNLVGR